MINSAGFRQSINAKKLFGSMSLAAINFKKTKIVWSKIVKSSDSSMSAEWQKLKSQRKGSLWNANHSEHSS